MFDAMEDDNLWREDLFAILGVTQDTPKEEIRKVYKNLAKKCHPDKFPPNSKEQEEAKEKFSKINMAHDVLTNDAKRNNYLDTRRLLAHHLDGSAAPAAVAEEPQIVIEKVHPGKNQEDAAQYKKKQAKEFHKEGQLLMKKKKLDPAIDAFKQCIQLMPEVAEYHSALGVAYHEKGWHGMAQSAFKQALVLDPQNLVAKGHLVDEKKDKGGLGGLFGMFKKK